VATLLISESHMSLDQSIVKEEYATVMASGANPDNTVGVDLTISADNNPTLPPVENPEGTFKLLALDSSGGTFASNYTTAAAVTDAKIRDMSRYGDLSDAVKDNIGNNSSGGYVTSYTPPPTRPNTADHPPQAKPESDSVLEKKPKLTAEQLEQRDLEIIVSTANEIPPDLRAFLGEDEDLGLEQQPQAEEPARVAQSVTPQEVQQPRVQNNPQPEAVIQDAEQTGSPVAPANEQSAIAFNTTTKAEQEKQSASVTSVETSTVVRNREASPIAQPATVTAVEVNWNELDLSAPKT
jgi:hypothetical protein